MNALTSLFKLPGGQTGGQMKALAGPLLIIMILGMMILPLPPFILDLLFTFNIALSIIWCCW
ncbi:flagellar biosynthesis protein FlhA [Cupriavidus basilensis OR16]|uniref:Flagellar biosynthesis protein FlhA n=1 Tax=Cupriavidus basilensis OR16 TaxID=1127483 RepID=H1SEN9_9BURK|nr:flagellar biosynthesis protein FlhA [Cupriavidus basilensis OR16]